MFNRKKKEIERLTRLIEFFQEESQSDAVRLSELQQTIDDMTSEIMEKDEELERLRLSVKEYEKETTESTSNQLQFIISDDLETVTPIIKYKTGVEEKLIEKRILNDGSVSPYAIQIGLAIVVKDALDYIVESATEGLDNG